jgi:hypothetical protein
MFQVGTTTDQIDKIVHETCIANNAYPSPLMYKGYPKSVCTSVNNVHCHGIPDDRPLEDGDIVNVDVSVREMFISYLVIIYCIFCIFFMLQEMLTHVVEHTNV